MFVPLKQQPIKLNITTGVTGAPYSLVMFGKMQIRSAKFALLVSELDS